MGCIQVWGIPALFIGRRRIVMKILKKTLVVSIVMSMLLAMALMFSGCGGNETLEDFVNSDSEAKEQIDSLSTNGMTIDISGNTLTYTYAYSQTFEPDMAELMGDQLEEAMSSMDSTFESVADTLEEESGIDDITVRVVYEDAAGTELYSEEF